MSQIFIPRFDASLASLGTRRILDEAGNEFMVPMFILRWRPIPSKPKKNIAGWVVRASSRGRFTDGTPLTKYFSDSQYGSPHSALQMAVDYLGSIYLGKARMSRNLTRFHQKDSWYPAGLKVALKKRPRNSGPGTWQFVINAEPRGSRQYVPIGVDGCVSFDSYIASLKTALALNKERFKNE